MYCICAVFGSIRIFGQRIHNPSDLRFRGIRLFGARAFHIMLSPSIKSISRFYAGGPRIMPKNMLLPFPYKNDARSGIICFLNQGTSFNRCKLL